MGSVLREIVVDCRDPGRLAQFWSRVLEWPVVEDDRGFCWLSSGAHAVSVRISIVASGTAFSVLASCTIATSLPLSAGGLKKATRPPVIESRPAARPTMV